MWLFFIALSHASCFHTVKINPSDVYDGDTIHKAVIEMDFGITITRTIRILGLDAPELKGVTDDEKKRAIISRDRLRAILNGCHSRTLATSGTDSFGRVLATVYCDGRDVAQQMISEKQAKPYQK